MVKPRVAVCVPAAITGIESDAVVEAVMAAGARQVYLIDEPIAAALGSGIDITQPDGRMIIDIAAAPPISLSCLWAARSRPPVSVWRATTMMTRS